MSTNTFSLLTNELVKTNSAIFATFFYCYLILIKNFVMLNLAITKHTNCLTTLFAPNLIHQDFMKEKM